MGIRTLSIVAVAALGFSMSPAYAESLDLTWQASYSSVRAAYPQTKPTFGETGPVLELADFDFNGIRWKAARFLFDHSGQVSAVQLVAAAAEAPRLRANLNRDDSPLWNVVTETAARTDDIASSDSVMLCSSGSEATLTYSRPASVQTSLTYAASEAVGLADVG